jgi:hypothetical protein
MISKKRELLSRPTAKNQKFRLTRGVKARLPVRNIYPAGDVV